MAKGTVKWFNTEKGYGFIQPADGGKDIFVHITAVQAAGLQTLKDNQPIEYELIDGRDGRKSAGAAQGLTNGAPRVRACGGKTRAAVRARHRLRGAGGFRGAAGLPVPSCSRSTLALTSSTPPGSSSPSWNGP